MRYLESNVFYCLLTIKDLGFARYGIFVNQHKYVLDLIGDAGLLSSKPASTPLPRGCKLSIDDGELLPDPQMYMRIVKTLIFGFH